LARSFLAGQREKKKKKHKLRFLPQSEGAIEKLEGSKTSPERKKGERAGFQRPIANARGGKEKRKGKSTAKFHLF